MTKLEKQGRRTLEAAPEPRAKTAATVLRIYYTSEGGELLCTDTTPMTWQAADKLYEQLAPLERSSSIIRAKATFAVHVERLGMYERTRAPAKGARLVVMPSMLEAPEQSTEAAA